MAKKAVATLHEGSTDGRAYTKVIKMVKSPKTGAYVFDERMIPNEDVKDYFKTTWGIDLDVLRDIVLKRSSEVKDLDLRTLN